MQESDVTFRAWPHVTLRGGKRMRSFLIESFVVQKRNGKGGEGGTRQPLVNDERKESGRWVVGFESKQHPPSVRPQCGGDSLDGNLSLKATSMTMQPLFEPILSSIPPQSTTATVGQGPPLSCLSDPRRANRRAGEMRARGLRRAAAQPER